MKICVCVKQVPDSWAEKRLQDSDKTIDRDGVDRVINELDEYAIEEALRLIEAHGGEVTIVSMGPDAAIDSVRKGISYGATDGILVTDPALHGSDAVATSLVLAKTVADRGYDLIMFGSESTDARMSVVPAMVAARLGLPQMTFAAKVEVSGSSLTIHRQTDTGYDEVTSSLPAVVSVVEKINEPRYPSFKGIMAAKKAPLETLSLSDIGVNAAEVGLSAAWSAVADFAQRPPKAKGTIVTDSGDGGAGIESFLVDRKFV